MKLNTRQLAFCREYMVDSNAKQAALRAGYAPKTAEHNASKLLCHVGIKENIARRQRNREVKCEATVDMVLHGLLDIAQANGKGAVRAWELIGKHLGMWDERRETQDSWNVLAAEAKEARDAAVRED